MSFGFSPSLHRIELVLEEVQRPLGRASFCFPPDFEVAFEESTRKERLRHARVAMLIAVAIYNTFLLIDYAYLPQFFLTCLVTRLALSILVPPVLWLPTQRSWILESIYATAFIPFAAVVVYLYSSTAELISAGQSAFLVILLYEISFVRPRFRYIAWATAFCVVCDSVFLLLDGHVDTSFRFMFIGLVSAAGITSLLASYWMERQERIGFLLRLHILTQNQELAGINLDLAEQSRIDPLTRIANRRFLDLHMPDAWNQAGAHHQPLAALMIDLDHFKALNDLHGHAYGDVALREVAQTLRDSIRGEHDLVARYGGEEFIVILPNRSLAKAITIAERICASIRTMVLPAGVDGKPVHLTISVGVAAEIPTKGREPADLIEAADAALYTAKRSGRNQVFPRMQAA